MNLSMHLIAEYLIVNLLISTTTTYLVSSRYSGGQAYYVALLRFCLLLSTIKLTSSRLKITYCSFHLENPSLISQLHSRPSFQMSFHLFSYFMSPSLLSRAAASTRVLLE